MRATQMQKYDVIASKFIHALSTINIEYKLEGCMRPALECLVEQHDMYLLSLLFLY